MKFKVMVYQGVVNLNALCEDFWSQQPSLNNNKTWLCADGLMFIYLAFGVNM